MLNEYDKYFEILELENGASKEEIKKAFRELSHIWHPDNHMGKSTNVQNRATEKFKEISNAYQVLNNIFSAEEKKRVEQHRREKEEKERKQREENERRKRKEESRRKAEQDRREKEEKEHKYWEEQAKKKHQEEKSKQKNKDYIYARCPECEKSIITNPTASKSEVCQYCGHLYYSFFAPNGILKVVSDIKGNERQKKEEESRSKAEENRREREKKERKFWEEQGNKKHEEQKRDAEERKNPRSPWIGGGLTLLSLGFGHIYGGELKRGVLFYLCLQFGWVSFLSIPNSILSFIFFLTLPLIYLIGIVDAVKICKKKKYYEPKIYNKWLIFPPIIIITILFLDPIKKDVGVRAFKITGSGGMYPTLLTGDHVLTKTYAYGFRLPSKIPLTNISLFPNIVLFPSEAKRGDIVIFKNPMDENRTLVGRVIGLPQEKLEIANEHVYINSMPLNEEYKYIDSSHGMKNDLGPLTIPVGHVFILRDNRRVSLDSRNFSSIAMKKIFGKVSKIYWSWDREEEWIRSSRIGMFFGNPY